MSERSMDRRDFLHRLGLSGLALSMGPVACGSGGGQIAAQQGSTTKQTSGAGVGVSGPKTGLCTIAFRELPFQDVLTLAREVGFDGVEPWGKPDHLPLTLSNEEVSQARRAAQDLGLAISHFGCYVRIGDDLEREVVSQQQKEADMARSVEITKLLGTDICRIWAGNKDSELMNEADWDKIVRDGKTFCALAEDAGVTLAIEMHGRSVTNKAAASVELIERVGSPALKLNYQILNSSEDPYERARIAGPHVVMVHAQNQPREGGGQGSICGGVVDFQKVWDILHGEFGFDGYMEVEFVGGETPAEKRAALVADCECLHEIG
jgi:sugar phosphate isomerase/epimerase